MRTFPNPRKTEALGRAECSPSEDCWKIHTVCHIYPIGNLLQPICTRHTIVLQKISLNHYSRIESKMSTSTSVDASALQEKSYSHKPPTRKPSDRLREKIHRDSCARMEEDKGSQNVETIGDGDGEMKMSGDDDESANVASKDIEKKVKLPAASSRNKTEPDQPHTETTQRPGAFYVAGDEETSDGTRDAPTVPSVMMEVDELPVAAELADDSDKYASVVEASKMDDVVVNYKSLKVQIGIFVLLAVIVGAIVGGVMGSKRSKEDDNSRQHDACTDSSWHKVYRRICPRSRRSRWNKDRASTASSARRQCHLQVHAG